MDQDIAADVIRDVQNYMEEHGIRDTYEIEVDVLPGAERPENHLRVYVQVGSPFAETSLMEEYTIDMDQLSYEEWLGMIRDELGDAIFTDL